MEADENNRKAGKYLDRKGIVFFGWQNINKEA
jgi:hypothetical protein